MKEFLKRMAIIGGIASIIFPIAIVTLWYTYVREQESRYGNEIASKKPCEPYSMEVTRDTGRTQVSWKTNDACAGFVLLGATYSDFTNLPYKILSTQGESPTKEHEVSILKQDETKYHYMVIVSAGDWYGLRGSPFEYR